LNRVSRVYIAYENFYNHKIRHLPGEKKLPNTWQKHGVVLLDVTYVLASVVTSVLGEELKIAEVLVVI